MKYYITVFMCLVSVQVVVPQFIDNHVIKERFYFEVGQIEEFIERFNFDGKTKLLNYLNINEPDLEINRIDLLYSLFDSYGPAFDKPLARAFINYVNDSVNPKYLCFYDNDWYAEVSCIFEMNGHTGTGQLILKNQFKADSSSKWVISGVSSEMLKFPDSKDSTVILSPVSHGTDFIALYNILQDGENIKNYIAKDFTLDTLTYFVSLANNNKIRLKQIYKVKYHFMQIPEWIFTVDYFNRKDLNSGWLISGLERMAREGKENYKIDVLKIYRN